MFVDLYNVVMALAFGLFVALAIILTSIITEELRIRKQIGVWKARKEQPIIDVWGNHTPAINNQPATILDIWNTEYL